MEDQPLVDGHQSILATVAVEPQRTCSTESMTLPTHEHFNCCAITCANIL